MSDFTKEELSIILFWGYDTMTTYEKPPLGVLPRHFWLMHRIKECVHALQRIDEIDDWTLYLTKAVHFANEIKFAAEEWEKYCNESRQKTKAIE